MMHLVLAGACVPAAALGFKEGFEPYAIGPLAGQGEWIAYGGTDPCVVTATALSGSRGLSWSTVNATAYDARPMPTAINLVKRQTFEWWARIQAAATFPLGQGPSIDLWTGVPDVAGFTNWAGSFMMAYSAGSVISEMHIFDGVDPGGTKFNIPVLANVAFKVGLQINGDGTYSLMIDGALFPPYVNRTFLTGGAALTHMGSSQFISALANADDVVADDLALVFP